MTVAIQRRGSRSSGRCYSIARRSDGRIFAGDISGLAFVDFMLTAVTPKARSQGRLWPTRFPKNIGAFRSQL